MYHGRSILAGSSGGHRLLDFIEFSSCRSRGRATAESRFPARIRQLTRSTHWPPQLSQSRERSEFQRPRDSALSLSTAISLSLSLCSLIVQGPCDRGRNGECRTMPFCGSSDRTSEILFFRRVRFGMRKSAVHFEPASRVTCYELCLNIGENGKIVILENFDCSRGSSKTAVWYGRYLIKVFNV